MMRTVGLRSRKQKAERQEHRERVSAFDFPLLALGLFLACVGVPHPAGADNDGIVKGTVSLPPDTGSPKDVVVYLDGEIGTPAARKATIDQKDKTFIPHVVPVTVGSTVEFF